MALSAAKLAVEIWILVRRGRRRRRRRRVKMGSIAFATWPMVHDRLERKPDLAGLWALGTRIILEEGCYGTVTIFVGRILNFW